jgi:hypothetical protein
MSLIAKLRDRANDYLLGISAAGIVPMDQPGHVYYAAMPHRHVRAVLDLLDLTIDDVFCDIGCGKGRVLALTALHRPPRRLIGIYLAENDGHREVFDDHLWLTRSRHVHIGPTLVSLYTSVG